LSGQLNAVEEGFARYKASIGTVVAGLEPETVLVIEIRGTVSSFVQAVDSTDGLDWLGEWDVDELEPDQEFHKELKIGTDFFLRKIEGVDSREQSREIRDALASCGFIDGRGRVIQDDLPPNALPDNLAHLRDAISAAITSTQPIPISRGRVFLSLANETGLQELMRLWRQWERGEDLPTGKTKWRDVFNQTKTIRRWGMQETLQETGMLEKWRDLLDPLNSNEPVMFQIELFYASSVRKRRLNEQAVSRLVQEAGGQLLSGFVDMPDIGFHAVKAMVPSSEVQKIIQLDGQAEDSPVHLFIFAGVMYFRPTGQAFAATGEGTPEAGHFITGSADLPPVAAILDGVPNHQHEALRDRVDLDDPDGLADSYQFGERVHGTNMASLIVHGDLGMDESFPISSRLYFRPIMQPDAAARAHGKHREHVPPDVFLEDLVERGVRRMFEGEGETPAQADTVRVINFSLGDPERPFTHTPSPLARLLDWLSWKYRVLFCVSSGNCLAGIDLGMHADEYARLTDEEKTAHLIRSMEEQLSERRLLSPAESMNAVTVGALHADYGGAYVKGHRVELAPDCGIFSPIMRFGFGFRRSVKPEILLPGGRQLYNSPVPGSGNVCSINESNLPPGQLTAWDGDQEGDMSRVAHSRGTSNAAALATRNAVLIHDALAELQQEAPGSIPDELMAVMIKALLVHGAAPDPAVYSALRDTLLTQENRKRFREVAVRHLGYGSADVSRVVACTEQRGTVIGCHHIRAGEIHEYRFPIPTDLSESSELRRMIVTLAWFSPINPRHRNLREAKLEVQPAQKWNDTPLMLERTAADHSQVKRGTVQHEILEGDRLTQALDGHETVVLHVSCKADATENLDEYIPYGLAATLEVSEESAARVYGQIRLRLEQQVQVGAAVNARD